MYKGKTFAFFHTAARQFPWATQIAKVDSDAFPFVHKMVKRLYGEERCRAKYEYWGSPFGKKHCDHEARDFRTLCPEDSCMMTTQECHDQMDGGLYGLSRDLALDATERGTAWERGRGGNEDGNTGSRLHEWAQERGQCVSMWNMRDSYYHHALQGPRAKKPVY